MPGSDRVLASRSSYTSSYAHSSAHRERCVLAIAIGGGRAHHSCTATGSGRQPLSASVSHEKLKLESEAHDLWQHNGLTKLVANTMQSGVSRTSLQLYRDCLRLVKHMAGNSAKGNHLRAVVRGEFKRNKDEEDPDKVAQLKTDAIRGLTNYLVYQASEKDDRLKANIDTPDDGSSGSNS